MKTKTKLVVLAFSMLSIFALMLCGVFAVKNFEVKSGGTIEFVAPGISATISSANLSGMTKKATSGQMSEFSITKDMSESQITELDGYKSWSNISLLFDEESEGVATLSFSVTNNSTNSNEYIMVELATPTATSLTIIQDADFCIAPGKSQTFVYTFKVENPNQSVKGGFSIPVEMSLLKPSQVQTIEEYKTNHNLDFIITGNKPRIARVTSTTTKPSGEVEIPSVIKDNNGILYTVTEISYSAFYGESITKVTIPNTITKILDNAFDGCTKLTEIKFPNNLKEIGYSAFYGCKLITEVELPKGLTSLGQNAFAQCSGLGGEVNISGVSEIGQNAFYYCTKITSIVMSDEIKIVKPSAFYYCSSLTSITFSKNIEEIGTYAFYGANKMTTLSLPKNIKHIGNYAFSQWEKIEGQLSLPEGLQTLGDGAFSSCRKITDVYIPSSITSMGKSPFQYCESLNSIIVDQANTIYNDANGSNIIIETATNKVIGGCKNSVIPEYVTEIGDYAFAVVRLAGDLVIPDNVTRIGEWAFYYSYITSVKLPSKLTYIGSTAFMQCYDIGGELDIPSSVTYIGKSAFSGCNFTGDLVIPDGVTDIYAHTFSNNNFSSITFSKNLKTIGQSAFYDTSYISGDLILPSTLTTIGSQAFAYSSFNGKLFIPENVTSIAVDSFNGCRFSEIEVASNNAKYDSRENCNAIIETETNTLLFAIKATQVPTTVIAYGNSVFGSRTDLTTIEISAQITKIGSSCFYGCTKLTSIVIRATTPPTLGNGSVFDNTNNATIYVPQGTLSAYQSASYWSEYASRMQESA